MKSIYDEALKISRAEARAKIVREANRHRVKIGRNMRVYTMKDLHKAVFVCRQNWLVHDSVLVAAGFNPVAKETSAAT